MPRRGAVLFQPIGLAQSQRRPAPPPSRTTGRGVAVGGLAARELYARGPRGHVGAWATLVPDENPTRREAPSAPVSGLMTCPADAAVDVARVGQAADPDRIPSLRRSFGEKTRHDREERTAASILGPGRQHIRLSNPSGEHYFDQTRICTATKLGISDDGLCCLTTAFVTRSSVLTKHSLLVYPLLMFCSITSEKRAEF